MQNDLFLSWLGTVSKTYFIQRSTNLATQPAFITIYSNYENQRFNETMVGTNTFLDTTATGGGPWFYRVGIQ